MPTLYDFPLSGNCYKVRLLLAQLDIPYRKVFVDRVAGENRKPEYLAKNPHGKVPLLELEDRTLLSESGAILHYLADGTPFLPTDRLERARLVGWLTFEQYSVVPNIGMARYWISVVKKEQEFATQIADKHTQGYAALATMESHLARHDFFVGERYTIADIALYAYTHLAPDGKFDLSNFPSVVRWLERVRAQPKHVSLMD